MRGLIRRTGAVLALICQLVAPIAPATAQIDPVARGLAARVLTMPKSVQRQRGTLLVIGQSTEQGPVALSDKAAWPNAFVSARNPGFAQTRLVPVANRGGWWPKVYDDLWDWGYDFNVINGAIGGVSILTHLTGVLQVRQNNAAYYQRRASAGYPDLGYFGDVVQITNGSTRHFVVTGGRGLQAFNAPPFASVVGAANYQDYVLSAKPARRADRAPPTFPASRSAGRSATAR